MPSEYDKYYKVLDLEVGASKEEVKKAWRELSQIYHPDNYARKSPGSLDTR
jgi:DnaJ-class molecular chaperone